MDFAMAGRGVADNFTSTGMSLPSLTTTRSTSVPFEVRQPASIIQFVAYRCRRCESVALRPGTHNTLAFASNVQLAGSTDLWGRPRVRDLHKSVLRHDTKAVLCKWSRIDGHRTSTHRRNRRVELGHNDPPCVLRRRKDITDVIRSRPGPTARNVLGSKSRPGRLAEELRGHL